VLFACFALYLLIVLLYSTINQMRPEVVIEAVHDYERERIAAQSTSREYKRLQDHLKESEDRFNREADPSFRERLLSEVLDTKRAVSELETSQEFIGMQEFVDTQERRRGEIKKYTDELSVEMLPVSAKTCELLARHSATEARLRLRFVRCRWRKGSSSPQLPYTGQ